MTKNSEKESPAELFLEKIYRLVGEYSDKFTSQENLTRISGGRVQGRIFKLLRSPGIDSKEAISPAYAAWRAGTLTLFLLGS
jgi:hypothetical protein